MNLVEFTAAKGGPIWVNPSQLLYVCSSAGGGGSMYGDNNVNLSTKLCFVDGSAVEVKEILADVVARLDF